MALLALVLAPQATPKPAAEETTEETHPVLLLRQTVRRLRRRAVERDVGGKTQKLMLQDACTLDALATRLEAEIPEESSPADAP